MQAGRKNSKLFCASRGGESGGNPTCSTKAVGVIGTTIADLHRYGQPEAAEFASRQDQMTWTTVWVWCSSKIWRQAMKSDPSQIRMILTAVLAILALAAASAALAEEQPSIPPA